MAQVRIFSGFVVRHVEIIVSVSNLNLISDRPDHLMAQVRIFSGFLRHLKKISS